MLDAEIVSADSRQVFRHLTIGTSKPTREEQALVPHHYIDELMPDQEFSAGVFGLTGRERIEEIFSRKKTPLVVGGSGLYVRALVDGFFEGPGADRDLRASLERRLADEGIHPLLEEVRRVDPEFAATVDPTKPRRIIRALEVIRRTGIPLSRIQREAKVEIAFHPVFFGLDWGRAELYRRIEERCDRMIRDGLLKEVDRLETLGFNETLQSLKTVGYAEAFAYRRGRISYEEMIRLFKQNSRRYAKRQLTWFRRDKRVRWIPMDPGRSPREVAEEISDLIPGHSRRAPIR